MGINNATISRYRRQLEAVGEIDFQEKREGLDGKIRESTVTNVTVESEPDPFTKQKP